MKTQIILLTLVVLPFISWSQRYNDYRSEQKEIVFAEEFDDQEDSKFAIKAFHETLNIVKDGVLRIDKTWKRAMHLRMHSRSSIGISNDYNWEFEMRIKYEPYMVSKYYMILMLGRKDLRAGNEHIFFQVYNRKSKVLFETPYSNERPKKMSEKLEHFIRWGEYNLFTIRKAKGYYILFINQKFCFSIPESPLEPSGILEMRFNNLKAEIDYIRVNKLK